MSDKVKVEFQPLDGGWIARAGEDYSDWEDSRQAALQNLCRKLGLDEHKLEIVP